MLPGAVEDSVVVLELEPRVAAGQLEPLGELLGEVDREGREVARSIW